ncbi:conserved oligomeric Golgi complex subunit 8-like [Xenia sp. Carnegie-2017]|uniref:conserved oligomeric Golgi complex subunit 8-like n=1 Tax=Xenia sp. Carnegie-2017 TaxID=2897299 RepID=UPI001F03BDC4|nr:conserved oligomeric Golgi complex subunit 8-like [Xenia sp. Carnegie-2017]
MAEMEEDENSRSLPHRGKNTLSAIFEESIPDNWKENPDFTLYLTELSSSNLDKLVSEPEKLCEERSHLLEETQDLAFNNYKTFIKTADCSREIFEDFIRVESQVDSLLNTLPSFDEKCKHFQDVGQEINLRRYSNSLILSRHTQLLEVLEIPQLMDTCVRNGYYEEALELSAFVKRLEKRFSNIAVVKNIINDVYSSNQLMLTQLLQQLRTNIQLPQCLRIIGYLRRLDAFSETELRMKFLQARDTWLSNVLSAIPHDDPYHHITKTIESSRVHLFDIITQYRAIFSDDDPGLLAVEDEDLLSNSCLFNAWIVQKISSFLCTLKDDLKKGVGSRSDSLLGQCMYFGLSFSRVGADFRGLLLPLFQDAALSSLSSTIEAATQSFKEAMNAYELASVSATLTATILASTPNKLNSLKENLSPPVVLLEHPPLASYTNVVLTSLNELRLCAPLGIAQSVMKCVENSLRRIVSETLSFYRTESSTLNEQEKDIFKRFCHVLSNELIPYLNKCLQILFSTKSPGVSKNAPSVLSMNITDLVSPLSSMIPNDLLKHNDIIDNVSSLDTANYDKTDSSLQYKGGVLKRSEKISSENASTEGKITNSESMEMFVDGKR